MASAAKAIPDIVKIWTSHARIRSGRAIASGAIERGAALTRTGCYRSTWTLLCAIGVFEQINYSLHFPSARQESGTPM